MDSTRIHRRGFLAIVGATAPGVGGILARARAGAVASPRLTIGPIRRVGVGGSKYFEPWIAAHPRNASNLVIVASRDLSEAAIPDRYHMEPAAWFSLDGGSSWASGDLAGTADLLGGGRASPTPTRPTPRMGR